jgi:hypothetical protein
MTSTADPPRLIALAAPSKQVVGILDAAEAVRVRLVLLCAMAGDQRIRQLQLLAGELRQLGEALRDESLDGRLSRLGSALALMGEVFRNLAGWCNNVSTSRRGAWRRICRRWAGCSLSAPRRYARSPVAPTILRCSIACSDRTSTARMSSGSSGRPCRGAGGQALRWPLMRVSSE